MCGIAGYIGSSSLEPAKINKTLSLMSQRGPDQQNFASIAEQDKNIVLLHSRLSIVDLDPRSNQPFVIDGCHLVFNGEIYNYIELRQELEKKGISFRTSSDTEVLLRAYLVFGEKCVDYFEGMWSFAIYDSNKKRLFLSRDRFAEKPLYYTQDKTGFYFASETRFLKSLTGKQFAVNQQQILRYLINGYKSLYKTKDTFFENIHEVDFATNIIVDHHCHLNIQKYWTPQYNPQSMTLQEAIDGTRERLIKSVKIRLRSDVPIAFCLSGGVDSASLVSIAAKELHHKVATFSIIEDDERYNEYDNIMATVHDTGCSSHLIHLKSDNVLSKLRELIAYHDAPIATISYYIHSLLSESISQQGYKVVFSGTAADELFTGYYDHFLLHLYEVHKHANFDMYRKNWEKHVRGFVRNPLLQNPYAYVENINMRDHIYFKNDEFEQHLLHPFQEAFSENNYSSSLLRNRMLNELFHEATRVILHEDDLNSMKQSIENRSPYLDTDLFNFAFSIPPEHLIMDGFGKYILREAMKGILNDHVRLDRNKKGFNASISSLINFSDPETRDYLLDPQAKIFSLLSREKISQLFTMSNIPNSYSKYLFNFINLRIFLEEN